MNDNRRKKNSKVQRALVLQGGGSLGAYEAGVVNVLYHWIKKDLKDEDNENIFDIVAGTSIGAINAAILVSPHTATKSLNEPPKQLLRFWKHLSSDSSINELLTQYGNSYWEGVRMLFPFIRLPSSEAFRRYLYTGISNSIGQTHVFSPRFLSPVPTQIYNKFYDFFPLSAWWYQYDKEPLKRSIKEFAKFPISTNMDDIVKKDNNKLDPRLLLVSVDIEEGATVTFDSYPYTGNECEICKLAKPARNLVSNNSVTKNKDQVSNKEFYKFKNPSELIEHIDKFHRQNYRYRNINKGSSIHWSVYDGDANYLFYEGIELEHVIASASIPKNYGFEIIDGHKFWDGGILSNTPLRELISNHITWWSGKLESEYGQAVKKESKNKYNEPDLCFDNWYRTKDDMKIPDLKVYVVNLHPTKEGKEGDNNSTIAEDDYDMMKDRENDIRFHDKTEYDQKVATLVTDYITFIDKIGDLAIKAINKTGNSKQALEDEFNEILKKKGLSTNRAGQRRIYQDLIKNKFNLKVEIKIERKDDIDTISNKVFDFSPNTISRLIIEGIYDTLHCLVEKNKKLPSHDARKNLEKFINDIGEPTLDEEQYMIDTANKLFKTL
jgi:NTE family protein